MSDASISERPVAESPVLTDRQVADYLQHQPQFFIRQPTLLNSLQIPHYSRGAVSLVELQLLSLRQQVSDLQQQQRELLARAAENERLFFSLLPLQRQLLQAPTLADGLQALQQWSRSQGLLACGLRLFSDCWQLTAPSTAHELALSQLQFEPIRVQRFGQCFFPGASYLGPLNAVEQQLLLPDVVRVGSVALQRLGVEREWGVLVFASRDPQHFQPGMATHLLQQVATMVEHALPAWVALRAPS